MGDRETTPGVGEEEGGDLSTSEHPPAHSHHAPANRLVIPVGRTSEREVLVNFHRGCGGPHWVRRDNWLEGKPLGEWAGVTVDIHLQCICELQLGENCLRGRSRGCVAGARLCAC